MKALPAVIATLGMTAFVHAQSLPDAIQKLPKIDAPGAEYPGRHMAPHSTGSRYLPQSHVAETIRGTTANIFQISPSSSITLDKEVQLDLR